MTKPPTRIVLADDHAVVRRGLRLVLEAQPDLEVVAEAGDGIEAVRRTLEHEPDLVILDITMPRQTGIQAAHEIGRQRPAIKTLMLSMHKRESYFFDALKAGASGYVLKSSADLDLVEACRATVRGESFFYPEAIDALVRDHLKRSEEEADADDALSTRELEVVKLIAESYTAREIAEALSISEKTVDRHRSNILDKLGLRDRVALTRYAVRRGLVEP